VVAAFVCAVTLSGASGAEEGNELSSPSLSADLRHSTKSLNGIDHLVGAFERAGRVTRLYGRDMSTGPSPDASAEAFLIMNAGALGTSRDDLDVHPALQSQPLMYDRDNDTYEFTALNYQQHRDGVPVFRSRLCLVVRNEAGFPLVLASADLRPLGNFRPNLRALPAHHGDTGPIVAQAEHPGLVNFSQPELVIWAGVDDVSEAPVLAHTFFADNGLFGTADFERYLYVTDALTGRVLYAENQIFQVDVVGSVGGNATEGLVADSCGAESYEGMPHARIAIGATVGFADANGLFSIPVLTSPPFTVISEMRGRYFRVFNQAGAVLSLSQSNTPPAPANFTHNATNAAEFDRAQVNGYLHANVIRDFTLEVNPSYPVIGTQLDFPVNVNIADTCNAFYDGSSINFFRAGGGCTNTANSTIVWHEYGHHLVNVGGSGQGAYGEGMSDVMAILIADDPGTGYGFNAGCSTPLRTANNTCQYQTSGCSSCGSEIHACGMLISGAIWSTRNALAIFDPSGYRDILSDLTINSILIHSGSSIDPSITIDFLTLDDNDSDIFNGTPHYTQIASGFNAHNLDAPVLPLLGFAFPDGVPSLISPSGTTSIHVNVTALTGTPLQNTGKLWLDTGSGAVQINMTQLQPNQYLATFPSGDCGDGATYYFSAQATNGQTVYSPVGAPAVRFGATYGTSEIVILDEPFDATGGWTVANTALTDGPWSRGVPVGGGDREDPATAFGGSGSCWVTDNVDDNSDVDGGPTRLLSPSYNLAANPNAQVSYAWWLGVDDNDATDTYTVEVSANGGTNWTLVRTYTNTSGPDTGSWEVDSFRISDYVTPSASTRFRFSVLDNPNDSVTEAGLDALRIFDVECAAPCPTDVNGDTSTDFNDLVMVLAAWGACPGCPEDIDGDNTVGFSDVVQLLAVWGPCP